MLRLSYLMMPSRFLPLCLVLCGLCTALTAQKIVPLEGYDFLVTPPAKGEPVYPKMNCNDLVPPNTSQVTAGDSLALSITIDTSGFGPGGRYFCLNCAGLAFGTLTTTSDRITYFSDPGVEQGIDTLDLAFCNAAGDSCSATETLLVLVQREPRSFTFPVETLSPQERIEISVPAADLPGGVFCRAFIDCDDDYLGTEQTAAFLSGLQQNNDFRYDAARYGGTDRLCVQVCNEFGLCDQYDYFFEVVRPNVDLPFFDDFSNEGNRPRLDLWQNEDVLINRNYAVLPPSIGVATFDAVGPRGRPNGGDDDEPSPRDFLTSAGINMIGSNSQAITFYVQPRGLGNRPEIDDSLRLEFLTPQGEWQLVWSYAGLSTGFGSCLDTAFRAVQVNIASPFYYDGFQFRFSNLSDEAGALDHWHLDYVKIAPAAEGFGLRDISLVDEPPSVTKPYTALPYRQLVAAGTSLVRDTFPVAFWNHSPLDALLPITGSTYRITRDGNSLLNPTQFTTPAVPFDQPFPDIAVVPPGLFNVYTDELLDLPNTNGNEMYQVDLTYNLNPNAFTEAGDNYAPFVEANNTATTTTVFSDAYAYDDGTAEFAIQALAGQTVVQRYEAFTPEVLRGVSFRLPRTSTSSNANLNFDIVVYLGELTQGNEPDLRITVDPIYVEQFYPDSLDGFTSYAFPDSLDIPVGPFYVGWRQNGNCTNCVPFGMDRSNIVSGSRFFRNGSTWFEFDGCSTGALMIRPLVGDSPVPISRTEDRRAEQALVTLFPNPARDRVTLLPFGELRPDQLDWVLFSLAGQRISSGRGSEVPLNNLPAGLYVLRVNNSAAGLSSHHKLRVE